jgi:hypothetical protein
MQRRLETRVNLKTNLVDHPIDLFWKRYLVNLAREVWELELHIRLGLCMIISGIALKLFLLSTWYFWYPRIAFLTVLFIVSMLYLDPFDLRVQIGRIGKLIFSPDKAAEVLDQLDMVGLRRLSFLLLLIPTMLEMRTLSFLSQIKAESGWTLYNLFLASTLLALMMYLFRIKRLKPRECIYQGLLVLYGSALLVTLVKTDLSRMPVLAAPFLTATGTLVLTYQDDDMEWISRVLRRALRLTLREVLSSVSEKVSEDEMLQLAILRWIADYWASTPDTTSPPSQTSSSSTSSARPANSTSTENRQSTSTCAPQTPASTSNSRPQQRSSGDPRQHEVQWEELLPMLSIATEHMTSEVRMLQSPDTTNNTQSDPASETPQPPQASASQQRPQAHPSQSGHDGSTTDPFADLTNMLSSLNVDERAEPAVRAYRRAVESFPPQRKTAFMISIFRRCPAVLTLIWHFLFGSKSLFSSTMVILPFIILEFYRIEAWIGACEQIKSSFGSDSTTERDEYSRIPQALADADAMVILLSGDVYNVLRPPALLLVWQNVLNSVSALEVGLTAARCAETTVVAVHFAGNVMSLVQFGHEVHQHGLVHGLAVMAKEVLMMHASQYASQDDPRRREDTKYTSAAMGAMQNAQKVARNVRRLAEDEKLDHVLQPVLWTLGTLSGYGWLWGKDDEPLSRPEGEPTADPSRDSAEEQPSTDNSESPAPAEQSTADTVDPKVSTKKDAVEGANELSEVMEMVAQAYEKGLIDEAEKNHFLEKLSTLSDSELFDPPVIAGMKRSLQIVLDHDNVPETDWQVAESTHEASGHRINPSSLMKLVLTAYYRGQIDEVRFFLFAFITILSIVMKSDARPVSFCSPV